MAYAVDIYGKVKVPSSPAAPKVTKTPATNGYTSYQQYAQSTYSTPANPSTPRVTSNPVTLATQQKLKAAGYDPGPLDGIMGPKTQAALSAYNAAQAKVTTPVQQTIKPSTITNYSNTQPSNTIQSPAPATNQNDDLKQMLQGMFETYMPQQQPTAAMPDFSGTINAWKENVRNSLLSKIDAALASGLSQYANAGALAEQGASTALNQNDIERAKALQKIYDASEAAGQGRGGMNVTGQIAVNTQAQQGANRINQDLANYLRDIENAKNTLRSQAEQQKVQAMSDVESQALQELMESQKWGYDYGLSKQAQDLANRQFNFTSDLQTKQFNADEAWRDWQKRWETEQAAWSKSADNPQVQAQVLANKAQILSNQLAALQLQNYPQEEKLKLQQMQKEIEQIGKGPVLSDYDRQMNNIKLEQARIELENLKNGNNGTADINSRVSAISRDLDGMTALDAVSELQNNSSEYIQDIGTTEYSRLLTRYRQKAGI